MYIGFIIQYFIRAPINKGKLADVLTLETKSKILEELAQNKRVTNLARNTFSGPGKRKTLRNTRERANVVSIVSRPTLKNNTISGLTGLIGYT